MSSRRGSSTRTTASASTRPRCTSRTSLRRSRSAAHANVNEGSAYSADPGRRHRSGHRHRHELHRPLGRRQLGQLRHERRQDPHLRRRRRPTTRSPSTWSTRTAPSSTARTRTSVHVDNVAPDDRDQRRSERQRGLGLQPHPGRSHRPRQDTVTSYIVHWGDGSDDTYATNGAKTHTYADGASDHAITVDLVDEDGTFLDRANALSVTRQQRRAVDRDQRRGQRRRGLGLQPDPGRGHRPGHATPSPATSSTGATATRTPTRPTASRRTPTPTGPTTTTSPSTWSTRTAPSSTRANALSVHVVNVAPTAHLSGPGNVDEGSTHTYTFTVTDPGVDTFTVNTPAYPDCGTGGNYVAGTLATNLGGGSFDCTFPDGPTTTDVKIRVTDSDGASDTDTENVVVVAVANVDPVVTLTGHEPGSRGLDPHLQLHDDRRRHREHVHPRRTETATAERSRLRPSTRPPAAGSFDVHLRRRPGLARPERDRLRRATAARTATRSRSRSPTSRRRSRSAARRTSTRARPTA